MQVTKQTEKPQLDSKRLLKGIVLAATGSIVKVKDDPETWRVQGKREEPYEVIPDAPYCDCRDFNLQSARTRTPYCKHLIAVELKRR